MEQHGALTLVGVYRRTLRASMERIWENVLDWERLPWVHRSSYTGVRILDQSEDFWRAEVSLSPADAPQQTIVEVKLDRPMLRYFLRIVAGTGAGVEIITHLEPVTDRSTRISVEFHLPGLEPSQGFAAGAAYTRLYTRLWNEDEAMMVRRQAVLDEKSTRESNWDHAEAEPSVPLGSVAALRQRLPLLVTAHGKRFRIVDVDGVLVAHRTVCPHRGGPLEEAPLIDGCITCPWHGYRYEVRTGRNLGGHPLHLEHAPSVLIDPRTQEASLVFSSPPHR